MGVELVDHEDGRGREASQLSLSSWLLLD